MNKKLPVTMVAIAMLFISTARANLEVNAGARGEGIGFAYSAIADDAFGVLHNPAGIAFSQGWQVQLQYLRPTEYGYSAYLESPYSGLAAIRFHDERFGALAFNAFQSGSTAEPTSITTINAVNLGYARKLASFAAFGLGTKYQFETNYGKRKAFDLDLGVNINPTPNFTLALAGENILRSEMTPTWLNQEAHLDRKARASVAFGIPFGNNLGFLLAGYQAAETQGQSTRWNSLYNFGSEWWFGILSKVSFGLRGGYAFGKAEYNSTTGDYKRIHAGVSFNLDLGGRDMRLDYGLRTFPFESDENFAVDQFISFSYGFGGVPQQNRKTKQDFADIQTPSFEPTKPPDKQPVGMKSVPVEIKPQAIPAPVSESPKPTTVSEPDLTIKPTALPETAKPMTEPTPTQFEPKPVAATGAVPETPKSPKIGEPDQTAKKAAAPETALPTTEQLPKPTAPVEEAKPVVEPPPVLEVAGIDEVQTVEPTKNMPPPIIENMQPAKIEPNPADYMKLAVSLDVSDISMMGEKRIVFYIRPERVVKLTSWKLYILKSKLKDWSESKLEADAIHYIEGKGIPPINVIWNGTLRNGGHAPAGKYHFILTGIDKTGQRYISGWCKFGLN